MVSKPGKHFPAGFLKTDKLSSNLGEKHCYQRLCERLSVRLFKLCWLTTASDRHHVTKEYTSVLRIYAQGNQTITFKKRFSYSRYPSTPDLPETHSFCNSSKLQTLCVSPKCAKKTPPNIIFDMDSLFVQTGEFTPVGI